MGSPVSPVIATFAWNVLKNWHWDHNAPSLHHWRRDVDDVICIPK